MAMAKKFAYQVRTHITGRSYKTALEYGCGTANVSFFLKDRFDTITVADASIGMINEVNNKLIANRIDNLLPLHINLEQICSDLKADVIYTLMTMHHLKDIDKVVAEFSSMLNPGGTLIIGDLVSEDGNFHRFPENQEVHFGFENEYLKAVMLQNGLVVDSYSVFHEMERTHTGTAQIYPLFMMTAVHK